MRIGRTHVLRVDIRDVLVAGYDSGHGVKLQPGVVHAVCEHASLPPTRVAVVPDNLDDIRMCRSAESSLCVGVLTGTGAREELAANGRSCSGEHRQESAFATGIDLPAVVGAWHRAIPCDRLEGRVAGFVTGSARYGELPLRESRLSTRQFANGPLPKGRLGPSHGSTPCFASGRPRPAAWTHEAPDLFSRCIH